MQDSDGGEDGRPSGPAVPHQVSGPTSRSSARAKSRRGASQASLVREAVRRFLEIEDCGLSLASSGLISQRVKKWAAF